MENRELKRWYASGASLYFMVNIGSTAKAPLMKPIIKKPVIRAKSSLLVQMYPMPLRKSATIRGSPISFHRVRPLGRRSFFSTRMDWISRPDSRKPAPSTITAPWMPI
ncbi:hypothetical protein D3C80_1812580 [compost metagenome]